MSSKRQLVELILHTNLNNSIIGAKKKMPVRARNQSRRGVRSGYLAVEGQVGGFPCMVKDLTDDGAIVSLTGLMGIPSKFSLFIEPESVRYSCVVSMSKGNSVVVNFEAKEENLRYRDYVKRNAV